MRKLWTVGLLVAVVLVMAQPIPPTPHTIYGTVSTAESVPPTSGCVKLTLTVDDSTFVVDFSTTGNEYNETYSDTAALWIVTVEGVDSGMAITIFFEDTCLLENGTRVRYAGAGSSTDMGHLNLNPIAGIRPYFTDGFVTPTVATIDNDFTFGVTYTSDWNRAPTLLQVVVDYATSLDIATTFPGVDYTAGYSFSNIFTGTTFGKGGHSFYFYTTDTNGLPGYSDTMSFEVLNTPPDMPEFTLTPSQPFEDEAISVNILNPDDDIDGDAVSYVYEWSINGTIVGDTDNSLDASYTSDWDTVAVTVTPYDGEDYGTPNSGTVVVIAPELDGAAVAPLTGYRDDDFVYTVTYTNKRNIAPAVVQLVIDERTPVTMTPEDILDTDYTDGAVFTYTANFDVVGPHTYSINATDALGHYVETTLLSGPTIENRLPTAPTVVLSASPTPPREGSVISAVVSGSTDADGDPLTYHYTWYINGEPLTELDDTVSAINGTYFDKGDVVGCLVVAYDGYGYSDAGVAETITIENTPPEMPTGVAYSPIPPFDNDDIAVTSDALADDADGDSVGLVVDWYLDLELVYTGAALPASYTSVGDVWTVQAYTSDGEDVSDPVVFDVTVSNPTFTSGSVEPETGAVSGDEFTYTVVYTSIRNIDPEDLVVVIDGDISGLLAPYDPSDTDYTDGATFTYTTELYGRGTHTFAFVGEDEMGNDVIDEMESHSGPTLDNTAPEIASAGIIAYPDGEFNELGTLIAEVVGTDIDGDGLTYEFKWYVNGELVEGLTPPDRIGSDHFAKGDEVHYEVRAFDDEAYSDWTSSTSVMIENTPPQIDYVTIEPAAPFTRDDLIAHTAISELDGEDYDVFYSWYRDGEAVGVYDSVLPAAMTIKHEHWTVVVSAADDDDTSIDSASVDIANSVPAFADNISDTVGIVGTNYHLALPIVDDDDDEMTFELLNGPEGLTVSEHTGFVSWDVDTLGIFPVNIRVTDGEGTLDIPFTIHTYEQDSSALAPFDLVAQSGFLGVIPVSWEEPPLFGEVMGLPLDFTGYELYRKEGTDGEWILITTVSGLSYTDASVTPGTLYWYRVRAVYGTVNSIYSNEDYAIAGDVTASNWYSTYTYNPAPDIDGVLDDGEWDDATFIPLGTADVYVKNTGGMLYIGVLNRSDWVRSADDMMLVSVDDNYNGAWHLTSPSDEGEYRIKVLSDLTDEVTFQGIWGTYPSSVGRDVRHWSAYMDGASGFSDGNVIYEMAINIGDPADAIDAALGNIIGFRLALYNVDGLSWTLQWPLGSDSEDPASFGGLYLGEGTNAPTLYAHPLYRSLYLRHGEVGTLPLWVENIGAGTAVYSLTGSYTPWLTGSTGVAPLEGDIIVLSDGTGLPEQSLALLGYPYTVYYTASDFISALTGGSGWGLAVVNWESALDNSVYDALDDFYTHGGRIILSSPNLDESSSHTFWSITGISVYTDLGSRPSAINFDESEHPIFHIPQAVPPSVERLGGDFGDFGDAMTTSTGELIATFDFYPYPINGAITMDNAQSLIVNSFILSGAEDTDADSIPDGVELLANEIFYLGQKTDIPWLSVAPNTGVLTTHEEDEATITFDATALDPGEYTGYILVQGEDTTIVVECHLTVGEPENLELSFIDPSLEYVHPGDEIVVPLYLGFVDGMNIDSIAITINAPADFITPASVESDMGTVELRDMDFGMIRFVVTLDEPFVGDGEFARVHFDVGLDATVGTHTYLSLSNLTYNDDAFVTGVVLGASKEIAVLAGEADWSVKLLFTHLTMKDSLRFGIAPDATDDYDIGIDVAHTLCDTCWFDPYFTADSSALLDGFDWDFRGASEGEIVWWVETGDSAGKVEWNFRDEDTLSDMGSLYLNDVVDMRTNSYYFYDAGENLKITYRPTGEEPFVYHFQPGYTMLSLPVSPTGGAATPSELFPGNLGFWEFDAETQNWVSAATVEPSVGYVVLFREATDVQIWGTPIYSYETDLYAGWNLIGGVFTTTDFSDPDDDPDGSITGAPEHAYHWNTASRGYDPTNTLEAGEAYFVAAMNDCHLNLPGTGSMGKAAPTTEEAELKFSFSDGYEQTLTVGTASEPVMAAMPPMMGEDVPSCYLKVGAFVATKSLVPASDEMSWDLVVSENGATVSVSAPRSWLLMVDGKELPAVLNKGTYKLTLKTVPTALALRGNYPNPFNAATTIAFELPVDSDVSLTIYDVTGHTVANVVSDRLTAGFYRVNWDASDVSSGVYFYRLKAMEKTLTGRMLLVK